MSDNDQNQSLEIVEPSLGALEQMERASIDVQITTAKKYPRELTKVKQQMLSFATLDEETARGCFYTLPARKGGDGKALQGPSVRLAEIALASYGHLRAGSRVIHDDGKVITAQGVVHDLQNNVCVSIEVKRRVTDRNGRRYSDDMVVTTGNAACSIALRNATFRVIPLALVKPCYEAAKRLAIGDAKSLATRRADALEHFAKLGIQKDRVFAVLEVSGLEDINLDKLGELIGYANSIRDGEAKIDDVFPEVKKDEKTSSPAAGILGAANSKPTTPTTPEAPKQPEEPKSEATTPTPEERAKVIDELQALMLDHDVSELKLFDYARRGKHISSEIAHLFEAPTDVLAKLKFAVPTLGGKKGGAAK